ncbi:MAG: polyribonucleotide nucleotidyltransferase [Elusimicrobia bacterium GWA2_69_24]|nr:MAG: polyribonucleotide nucleotidyltransferase [Elusimicrobia bacterium GWA2_69_24]HBL18799.1 polyribonucleotide nucleotidyltransferase [Elusimicrobiota bacterium]
MTNSLQKICLSETIGGKEICLQTGTLAKQAGGAVTVHLGGTVLLVTATAAENTKPVSFIPLTVEYRERTYAAGKIPGGFFKREARPRDKETLNARMTDRPIRPLFPKGWNHETMVYSLLVSMDGKNDAGPLSMTGSSASLLLSDAPFTTPVAGVRIGRVKETQEFVLFPTFEERETLDLELVVAGKQDAILMVECGAQQAGEETVLQALEIAQKEINKLCALQERLVEESIKAGRKIEKYQVVAPDFPEPVKSFVIERSREEIRKQLRVGYKGKHEMHLVLKEYGNKLAEEIVKKAATDPAWTGQDAHVWSIMHELEGEEARKMIVGEKVRPDGRRLDEIRRITIQTPALPVTHGSVVFTRGETQALVTATLGTPGDQQIMDELEGDYKERFMLHYNFPAYSVGEVKPERGPSRRDIGHGTLARRALEPLLPEQEDFAYTIRIVSEILESNGSSSMATICGGSLAMFDAGVPLTAACAGIAMGLFMEDGKYSILTDIAGLEDHVGDMDFKVAGTRNGITALQMDIKVGGISIQIMREALAQAKKGRLEILDKMEAALAQPRAELSPFAPRLVRIQIPIDKIGALIGPGGKNIRRIIETYGVEVDVEDDGSVFIGGVDAAAVARARAEVEGITAEPEIGKIYKGRVVSCVEFGAFLEIMPGREGLLHISQMDVKRVERVSDVMKEGDEVEVKVLEVTKEGKVRLSRRAVIQPGSENEVAGPGPRRDGPRGGSRGGSRGGPGGRPRFNN